MVVITGGAGFLGSHLAEHLVATDTPVTLVDTFTDPIHTANTAHLADHPNVTLREADLRDRDTTFDVIAGHSHVYHLAAKIGGVGYLRDRPADIIGDNDLINKHVFDACVEHDIDRLVFAGSSMVYAEATTYPHHEDDIHTTPPPRGCYGFQKLNGEYYCHAYNEQYDLDTVSARIFNGVGPRDWPTDTVGTGHVIPDLVRKIITEQQNPVHIKGDGTQTRCFTDVRDLVQGLVACMTTPEAGGEAINLGTTTETSIRDLVHRIWGIAGRDGTPDIACDDPFTHDVDRRVPDTTKAETLLDWTPRHSLDEILTTYIDAYCQRFHDTTLADLTHPPTTTHSPDTRTAPQTAPHSDLP